MCRLKKSLYDLKQSPGQWYWRFDTFMIEHSYSMSKYNSCVYYRKLNDSSFVYLFLYVDNILIAVKNMSEVDNLKVQLKQEFGMKDLIVVNKIMGM